MKNLIKFSIVMVVLCITACTQTFENTSNEVQKKAQGRLVMKVGNESRTIKPTIGGSDVKTAVLKANGNEIKSWSDDNIISQIENTEDILLDVGNYDFTMIFRNAGNIDILTATTSKDIVAGNNSLNFNMKPVSTGYGNISITLNWDDPSEIYTITAGLYDIANNTPVEDFADSELEITSTEEQTPIATYSKNAVPVGSYIIKFKSYKDNILLNTSTDVIKVAAGITTSSQITLSKINTQYTITYNLSGGKWTGNFIVTDERNANKKITLPTANDITREGYEFAGWYDDDNTRITEIPSDTAKNISVTARWNTNTYTVKFEANDGSGEMTDQTFTYDVEQALTANTFTRKGYEFTGWATSADGEKVYDNNESVKNLTADNNATVTLYAKWIATETFIYVKGATITGAITGSGYTASDIFKDGKTVTVPDLYVCDHEVTQAEYTKYCSYGGTNPSETYGVGDNYPAYYVSWYDALVYCNRRSIAEGLTPCYTINSSTDPTDWGSIPDSDSHENWDSWWAVTCDFTKNGYRLPTEAEWEYAARGGNGLTGTQYTYAGRDTIDEVAWRNSNSDSKTHEVKGKVANGLGLYDMSGNVWEWCWDSYDSGTRFSRGGGWYDSEDYCTVSYRNSFEGYAYNRYYYGFRVVRTAKWYNAICTAENVGSVIASLSGEGPYDIAVTGAITNATISAINTELQKSSAKVNLDLSETTGLTSISDSAFFHCTGLTSVTIGGNVKSIGDHAFNGCGLKSVTIGNGVTSIGVSAFCDCHSLTSVTIGDSVTTIGNYAFGNCSSLASVTIGNSVTSIGISVFSGCSSLTTVNYKGTQEEWNQKIINGIGSDNEALTNATINYNAIIVTSDNVSDAISGLGEGGSYTIIVTEEISATTISAIKGALTTLQNNNNAKVNLDLSDTIGLTSIDVSAFESCYNLTSVTIPDSVTEIGSYAFSHCSSLTSVTIPDSVSSISSNTFEYCGNLTSVTIPVSVTSIGYQAFFCCSSLTTVNYKGTQEQWGQISKNSGNDKLTSATKTYNYTGE